MIRQSRRKIKLLVEGETEENYFKMLNKSPGLDVSVKSVNMNGGGYSNFLKKLKRESLSGYLALFLILDLDKALEDEENLSKLIEYCKMKNKNATSPYIIIGNNEDFEFFACCHCHKYKNTNTKIYIEKNLKYKDLSKFKSDANIFDFLNKEGRSYDVALDYLNTGKKYFNYEIEEKRKGLDINVKIKSMKIDEESLSNKHSNMKDLFELLLPNDQLNK